MKLFVNDLTVIDSSVAYVDRGIVGESWIVDLQLVGNLNDESMVLDFGLVKKQIKSLIDQLVDHCLIVPSQNPSISFEKSSTNTWVKNSFNRKASFYVRGPEQAFCFIDTSCIDVDVISKYLERAIHPQLPSNVQEISIKLREEQIDEPFYHYSHGLKKHTGNCQRIAHGHRSRIRVFKNGQLDRQLQSYWAERWQDIYIATEEDINLSKPSDPTREFDLDRNIYTCYESLQGYFEIILPRERVEVVNVDSTVEQLASYIAAQLAELNPNQKIEVQAFEGVGKGAIAEATFIRE
ncbi:6-carboxytetrahydropterin synthase [Shewanella xiamenensis]|uniref:6-carboxytetrahydropterin synthase n=1 Tax=Shewanella xiamenensis TaxID=332186 RepID=A0AAE4PWL8_9GAMM|nr:6-carboxytetrahydropterin synthase [Shewanella xiamenensis]MCT8862407.1 6-carboxytetrahydropterin synthase [Shewanella xiamenensis]MDH1315016.1 6-carboxytetrahydropterin synthase [Shewanella xiamenensis]MDV5389997.1 6-carboxytetrahydropterin synthase [Shewanella xiamenensis]